MTNSNLETLVKVVNEQAEKSAAVDVFLAKKIKQGSDELQASKKELGQAVADAKTESAIATESARKATIYADTVTKEGFAQVTKEAQALVDATKVSFDAVTASQRQMIEAQTAALNDFRAEVEASKVADTVFSTSESFDGKDFVELVKELAEKEGLKVIPKQTVAVYFSSEKGSVIVARDEKFELKQGYTVVARFDDKGVIVPSSINVIPELATDLALAIAQSVSGLNAPLDVMSIVSEITA